MLAIHTVLAFIQQRPAEGWGGALLLWLPPCCFSTWWSAVRAADRQRQPAERLRSHTESSSTTSPSPAPTSSRRGPAEGGRRCTRRATAAHRSSGSGRAQPHTTPSRRSRRRASTCSVSPAAFRLALAGRVCIGGGFMGPDRGGGRTAGRAGGTQASRSGFILQLPGRTYSGARPELSDLTPPSSSLHSVKADQLIGDFRLYFFKIKVVFFVVCFFF